MARRGVDFRERLFSAPSSSPEPDEQDVPAVRTGPNLPVSAVAARDCLPDVHLVLFLSDLVDSLDRSAIHADYTEERGHPPYHPLLMVKILVYGYARGIYSCRKLARACQEDVAFRVLRGTNRPDFWMISASRKRHLAPLSDLFLQVLHLCQRGDGEARARGDRRQGEREQAQGNKLRAHAGIGSAAKEGDPCDPR